MIYDRMNDCFHSMAEKVSYALDHSDLQKIFDILSEIDGPTLVTGSGGSSIVATYLAETLQKKNGIIADFRSCRDIAYMPLDGYKNVIAVSYSGSNLGVKLSFNNDLNHYLFTGNPRQDVRNIVYTMPEEISYVSINATIIPLSILFLYCNNDRQLLDKILQSDISLSSDNTQYEVLSGYETRTAAALLESSIIEAGIGTCIVHDKYNYCHGRINITKRSKADMILFTSHNELDDTLYDVISHYYDRILLFERRYEDDLINDFYLSVLSLKLIRNIAETIQIDISDMKEVPDNDRLYLFDRTVK
ncbi:MAG: hypothetical protein IKS51_07220 [Erysipelotrichaceae bacterium]|nr:hypothetical protein [Erysipelotrichaceae bacterium]